MKSKLLIAVTVLAFACQAPETKEALIKKKGELQKEIKEIEVKIAALDTTASDEKKVPVYIEIAEKHPFSSYVKVNGTVATDQDVIVSAEAPGRIQSIRVKRGQYVRKGDILVILDAQTLNKNLAELESQLSFAADLFAKQERLKAQNVGTEVQYLEAKNRKEQIENSIATLKTQIAKTRVVSPINGKIDEIFPKQGEMGAPGKPLVRLISSRDLYIGADVSEVYYNKIKVGDSVEVYFPFNESSAKVKVSYKGNYINPGNRTFRVHASLSSIHQDFPPNLLGVLKLREQYFPQAFTVPSKVVKTDDQKNEYVFVIENGKAKKKAIETAASYKGNTVVSGGLKEGDKIVVKGYSVLSQDEIVEIQN